MVKQSRPNQGGEVLNIPRGFLDPGETHFETAKRELAEETGLTSVDERFSQLEGEPLNPNSTFFETAGEGEGVKFFAFRVLPAEIERQGENYIFKPGVLKPVSKAAEGIFKCVLIPWDKAVKLGDMFTVAIAARLLDKIIQEKNMKKKVIIFCFENETEWKMKPEYFTEKELKEYLKTSDAVEGISYIAETHDGRKTAVYTTSKGTISKSY